MTMRTDCRHFESRSYASGETVRKCKLDLAPEAPWRCPQDCAGFERRTIDVGWQYGSLAPSKTPKEPEPALASDSEAVAALLDEAEDIVNAAGRDLLAQFDKQPKRKRFRRKPR